MKRWMYILTMPWKVPISEYRSANRGYDDLTPTISTHKRSIVVRGCKDAGLPRLVANSMDSGHRANVGWEESVGDLQPHIDSYIS